MSEIRIEDIRFSVKETEQYLENILTARIQEDIAAQWADATEGWIAGLRLAALSIRRRGDFHSMLPELKGPIQYVTEYLFNEILSHQPEEVRDYLLSTAILDRFCAPLCDAVHGPDAAPDQPFDSRRFIDLLEKEQLFTISLDPENYWFRYHHLFQDLLQNQLEIHFDETHIAGFTPGPANGFPKTT